MLQHLTNSTISRVCLSICAMVLILGFKINPNNPPNGKTGASFDGSCNESGCHSNVNNSFNGVISLTGLPATIVPSTAYTLTLTATATGSPVRAGFEMVVVSTSANTNAGTLANVTGGGTSIGTLSGRSYIKQSSPKNFASGVVSWTFNWTSPATVTGNNITFYSIVNLCNGSGTGGDRSITSANAFPFGSNATPLTASASGTNVTCFGAANGTATAMGAGGSLPYSYLWSNGQTQVTATNLTAGTYTVTVSGTSGTPGTASVNITQPTALNLTASTNGTATCLQSSTLTASGNGGNPPYTYSWSNGTTGSTINVNTGGTYFVTMTDASFCSQTASTFINSNIVTPSVTATGGTLSCNVPSINLSANSSTSGPTFQWSGPSGFTSTQQNPIVNSPGTYTVVVTNTSNGCTASTTTTVSSNVAIPNATAIGGSLTCSNTSVNLTANSTTSGVSYAWSGPGGFSSTQQNPTVTTSGNYVLTVTNPNNGCSNTATTTVTTNTNSPISTATGGTLSCTNSSITIMAGSGPGGSNFAWSGPNGFTSSLQNPTVSAAGNYIVTVTSITNGCTNTATATVLSSANLPNVSALGGTITCVNNSVNLIGNSTTSGVAYSWTGPGGFTSTQQNPTVTTAGIYTLVVNNPANGCSSSATTTVSVNTLAPTAVAIGGTLTCSANTILLNASSNEANATFLWSGANGFTSTLPNPSVNTPSNFSVIVTNPNNGCSAIASAVVDQNIVTPSAIIATHGNFNCNNNALQLNANASSQGANINFNWTTQGGNIQSGGNSPTPTVNVAGTYFLTISNTSNGCTANASTTVSQTPAILASISNIAVVSCNGLNNGAAIVNVSGGALPINYQWSNGIFSPSINGLAAGTYSVTVSDAENCSTNTSVVINQPLPLVANATSSNLSSNIAIDGSATTLPSGGTAPYTFQWLNGATSANLTGLSAGNYTVTVTDAHGCTDVQTVSVNAFNCAISVAAFVSNPTCIGTSNGQISLNINGGSAPFTYLWSNGATNNPVTDLSGGTFVASITDALGCNLVQTSTLIEPMALQMNIENIHNVACSDGVGGDATINVNGGTSPINIVWSNGQSGIIASGLGAGSYTATATDANGCVQTLPVTILAIDHVTPSIVCPQNVTVCAPTNITYTNPVVTDNCTLPTNSLEQITGLPSGSAFPIGTTLNTFQAKDAAGNTNTCTFSVTIAAPATPIVVLMNDLGNAGVGSINVTFSIAVTSYQWTGPNGFTANTKDISGLLAGTYTLTTLFENGCSSTTTHTIGNTVVGTINIDQNELLHLYPNPVLDNFKVEYSGGKLLNGKIYDLRGRLLQTIAETALQNEISAVDLPTGVYYLHLFTKENRVKVVKFVK
jgi:large repetitive protein